MVTSAMSGFGSLALKIVVGAGLFVSAFWLTLLVMDQFEPASPWQPIRSNAILTFGDASSSARTLTDSVSFRFLGKGHAEVEDTKGLRCRENQCRFSLIIAFAPQPADLQLIIGQSFAGEYGWHLLLIGGRLVLQTEAGAVELAAPFAPKPGQRYKIEIARAGGGVTVSVDGVALMQGDVVPFSDIARNLTIGGRDGPIPANLTGTVSNVEIAKLKPQ